MNRLSLNLIFQTRKAYKSRYFYKKEGYCSACGKRSRFTYKPIINEKLAKEWQLNNRLRKAFSLRESMSCGFCASSARSRAQAAAMLEVIDAKEKSLKSAIDNKRFDNLVVAEINSCGFLHEFLDSIPHLFYSEYKPKNKKISHQDLMNLKYNNNTFDIILTSETLEHIPEPEKALREIWRTLKPGGWHIFTVPLIIDRKTKERVSVERGKVINKFEPSYHGCGKFESDFLVCREYGSDFFNLLKKEGFHQKIYFLNPFDRQNVNFVIASRKP